jgi:hypothetical protein
LFDKVILSKMIVARLFTLKGNCHGRKSTFALTLERIQNYEFKAQFDWDHLPPLLVDEGELLGQRKGPNPHACWRLQSAIVLRQSVVLLAKSQDGGQARQNGSKRRIGAQ